MVSAVHNGFNPTPHTTKQPSISPPVYHTMPSFLTALRSLLSTVVDYIFASIIFVFAIRSEHLGIQFLAICLGTVLACVVALVVGVSWVMLVSRDKLVLWFNDVEDADTVWLVAEWRVGETV
jgi:hypothetical protein